MKRYENFVGLTEVKAAQRRVVEVTQPVWHSNCKRGFGRQIILISKGNQNFGQKVQIAHFVKRIPMASEYWTRIQIVQLIT